MQSKVVKDHAKIVTIGQRFEEGRGVWENLGRGPKMGRVSGYRVLLEHAKWEFANEEDTREKETWRGDGIGRHGIIRANFQGSSWATDDERYSAHPLSDGDLWAWVR